MHTAHQDNSNFTDTAERIAAIGRSPTRRVADWGARTWDVMAGVAFASGHWRNVVLMHLDHLMYTAGCCVRKNVLDDAVDGRAGCAWGMMFELCYAIELQFKGWRA